ncbi:PQQ-binding-like beta-propeller repeat protein [Streptomyces sp. NPDC057239]|uniref:outer membrane protein assembly factor BamB family protein n=1 Tax=Streptomyces sp. NPDC057239 TaxID=3346061 RepID=UPI003641B9AA
MWMNGRVPLPCALLLAMSVMISACSGGGGDGAEVERAKPPSPTRKKEPSLPNYDPPKQFTADGIHLGTKRCCNDDPDGSGRGYVVDSRAIYYMTSDTELVAHDLATGKRVLSFTFDNGSSDDAVPLPKVTDGRIFNSYLVPVEGTGTQAERRLLRVVAVDARTGRTLWSVDLDEDIGSYSSDTPSVFAANSEHVVVERIVEGGHYTAILNAKNGELRWQDREFHPYAFDGQVLAGQTVSVNWSPENQSPPEGRAVTDGTRRWKLPNRPPGKDPYRDWGGIAPVWRTDRADDALFLVSVGESLDAQPKALILRARDGKQIVTIDTDSGLQASQLRDCWHDGRQTIVCQVGVDSQVDAYDEQSGKKLWSLPDEAAGRIAPEVTAVHNGAVYGSTDNGSLILNARTGKDMVTDLVVKPHYVGPGFGIAPLKEAGKYWHEIYLYPATN